MMAESVLARFAALLQDRASAGSWSSFEGALNAIDHGQAAALARAYTESAVWFAPGARLLGRDAPRLEVPDVDFTVWTLETAARTLLLLRAARALSAESFMSAATACYESGDADEQQSWLRGLPLLPDPKRFLPIAIDACRTNIVPVFESIACENSYPARYFPERNFNQLVLKAMFNRIALSRIIGLRDRRNAELTRMSQDYADERRAAGRAVPPDIDLAMTDNIVREQPL